MNTKSLSQNAASAAIRLMVLLGLTLPLMACDPGSDQKPPTLQAQTLRFSQTGPFELSANRVFTNQAIGQGNGSISYASSNTEVAEVDATGTLTAVGAGTAEITATIAADRQFRSASAQYQVTVQRNAISLLFESGSHRTEVLDQSFTNAVIPSATISSPVVFTSQSPSVASVDSSTGEVTAIGIGHAEITASVAQTPVHQAASASYSVQVERKSRQLNFTEYSEQFLLTLEQPLNNPLQPLNADDEGSISYHSSDPTKVVVTANGTVTALHLTDEVVTITASVAMTDRYKAAEASYQVSSQRKSRQLNFTQPTDQPLELGVDDTLINPLQPLHADDSGSITYSSSHPNVVIDANGKVTALNAAQESVTITARVAETDRYKEAFAAYQLLITRKDRALEISGPDSVSLDPGDEYQLEMTFQQEASESPGLLYTITPSGSDFFTVSQQGLVKAQYEGQAWINISIAQTDHYAAANVQLSVSVTNNLPTPVLGLQLEPNEILRFHWSPVPEAEYYQLSEDLEGNGNYQLIAGAESLSAATTTFTVTKTLDDRLNMAQANYILTACKTNYPCKSSAAVSMTVEDINNGIGYLKVKDTSFYNFPDFKFGDVISLNKTGNQLLTYATAAYEFPNSIPSTERDQHLWLQYYDTLTGSHTQKWFRIDHDSGHYISAMDQNGAGNLLAVGIPSINNDGNQSLGEVRLYNLSTSTHSFAGDPIVFSLASLSDSNPRSTFGQSVSLSDDGKIMAVGAPNYPNQSGNLAAVYIYERVTFPSSTGWSRIEAIYSQNNAFGISVDLDANGNTLAVGKPGTGTVYIFRRETATAYDWILRAQLVEPAYTRFGHSVSLSNDGKRLAVGAPGDHTPFMGILKLDADGNADASSTAKPISNLFVNAGAVHLYHRYEQVEDWRQSALIKAEWVNAKDAFGSSVQLSGNGEQLIVGSAVNFHDGTAMAENGSSVGLFGDPTEVTATDAGAAWLYQLNQAGTSWDFKTYLKAPNTDAYDYFGAAVAISDEGNTIAISAPGEDGGGGGIDSNLQNDNSANDTGAIYLY